MVKDTNTTMEELHANRAVDSVNKGVDGVNIAVFLVTMQGPFLICGKLVRAIRAIDHAKERWGERRNGHGEVKIGKSVD